MATAHDMSRYQRVISVEGGRVTGLFVALAAPRRDEVIVSPCDVSIWDEGHHAGRILRRDDLTAFVRGDNVDLPKHMISRDKLAEVEDAWSEVVAAITAVAELMTKVSRELDGGATS